MAKTPPDIRSLARKHTEAAIDKLAYWMRSDNPRASVSACAVLLDRGWGKAEQKIEGEHVVRYVADVPAVLPTTDEWQQQHGQTLQ